MMYKLIEGNANSIHWGSCSACGKRTRLFAGAMCMECRVIYIKELKYVDEVRIKYEN